MKCNKCNLCINEDMAQIPYIEHEHRMFKAYQRETKLKGWLIGTNIVWFIVTVICIFMR